MADGDFWLVSFGLWNMARDASVRAGLSLPDPSSNPTSDATVAVVMAAASAEAFINELAYLLGRLDEPEEPSKAFVAAVSQLEAERAPTTLKYLVASLILSGKMLDRGRQPFQDFSDLMRLRNAIMHLDPSGPPGVYKRFLRSPLSHSYEDEGGLLWLLDIQTEKMAEWACDAAFNIVCTVRDMVPEWAHWRVLPTFNGYWVR